MFLLDLGRKAGADMRSRSGRLVFRERFRLMLRRQFPDWALAEISADPNLERSLSPAFPRAFLRHGKYGWAAIACRPDGDASAALSFGLIWLSYLRSRERRVFIEGLAIYLPVARERSTALRLRWLNDTAARFECFTYNDQDATVRIDPSDCGNVDTLLQPCREGAANQGADGFGLAALPGVDQVRKHDGRVSLRVRGVEFGEVASGGMRFGLAEKRAALPHNREEIATTWRASSTASAAPMPRTATIPSIAPSPKPGSNRRRARSSK